MTTGFVNRTRGRSLFHSMFFKWAIESAITTGITASTTHSIAGGKALTTQTNVVSTVANAGDAVTLPSLQIGQHADVYNDGANAMAVYPSNAAVAIDGGSAGASVTLTNALRCRYLMVSANTIKSYQLGAVSA